MMLSRTMIRDMLDNELIKKYPGIDKRSDFLTIVCKMSSDAVMSFRKDKSSKPPLYLEWR